MSVVWNRWQVNDWLNGCDNPGAAARVHSLPVGDCFWRGLGSSGQAPPSLNQQDSQRMLAGMLQRRELRKRERENRST